MVSRSTVTRRIAMLSVLAILATGCSSGGSDEPSASDATTTTSDSPFAGGSGPESLPSEVATSPADGVTPTASDAGGAAAATSGVSDERRRQWGAPRPGRYEYRLGGDDQDGTQVFVDVIDRDPEFQPDQGVAQLWLRRTHHEGTLRVLIFDGRGITETDEYRFRDDGAFRRCAWEPAILEWPADPTPEQTWSWDSACTDPDREAQTTATARRQGTATILERGEVEVLGRTFEAWTYALDESDVITSQGLDVADRRALRIRWSPVFHLPLEYRGGVGTVINGTPQGSGGSLDRIVTDPTHPLDATVPPSFSES